MSITQDISNPLKVNLHILSNYLCYSLFCLRIYYLKPPNTPPSAQQDEEPHQAQYNSKSKLYHHHTTPLFSLGCLLHLYSPSTPCLLPSNMALTIQTLLLFKITSTGGRVSEVTH